MSQLFHLSQYGRLLLQGSKAVDLLHGQCSAEVRKMLPGQQLFTSINNVKGRAIATFLLWCDQPDRFYLETLKDNLPALQGVLAKYAPLYRCQLSLDPAQGYLKQREEVQAAEHQPSSDQQHTICAHYPDGWQRFWSEQPLACEPLKQTWLAMDLKRGWTFLSAEQSEQFLPLWLGLDLIGGISFSKGCYTGQEVIARLHYRGKAKQQPTLAQGPSLSLEQLMLPEFGELVAYDLLSSPAHALWLQRTEQQGKLPQGWQVTPLPN